MTSWLDKHTSPEAPTVSTRALDTAFQPSATKWTQVSYCIQHVVGDGNDGKVELKSDAANPPTTIRATSRVALAGATGTIDHNLTYLVPPGHYVKLVSSGTGTPTIACQVEDAIS